MNALNKDGKYNPPVHMIAGGMTGATAAAVTTPLDVVKTLLNTQETGIGQTKGMWQAIAKVREETFESKHTAIELLKCVLNVIYWRF